MPPHRPRWVNDSPQIQELKFWVQACKSSDSPFAKKFQEALCGDARRAVRPARVGGAWHQLELVRNKTVQVRGRTIENELRRRALDVFAVTPARGHRLDCALR